MNKMHQCKKQNFRLLKRKYKKIFCVVGLGKGYFKYGIKSIDHFLKRIHNLTKQNYY